MNTAVKKQIISELDSLPDQKAYSLLDYLHFLKQDQSPNKETLEAINEIENDKGDLKTYDSTTEMFKDLGID